MNYPAWFQEFLDAPTEKLPGYFGDWMDMDCDIEEDGESLLFKWRADFDGEYEPIVKFFGNQKNRRIALCKWAYQLSPVVALANAVEKHPDLQEDVRFMAEMPIRLSFASDYATKVLGKEWA